MDKPQLISVIIPVYNVHDYLEKCIDSVVAQSYWDIEILLINDGSTDGSEAICGEYAKQDSRIKVIHQAHQGPSAARNRGMEKAKGCWLFFVDGDDWIEPDMISFLYEKTKATDADVVACGFYKDDEPQKYEKDYYSLSSDEGLSQLCLNNRKENPLYYNYVWNKLYSANLLRNIRFPEGLLCEDMFFTGDVIAQMKRMIIYATPKYHYITRKGSTTFKAKLRYSAVKGQFYQYDLALKKQVIKAYPIMGLKMSIRFLDHVYYEISDKRLINRLAGVGVSFVRVYEKYPLSSMNITLAIKRYLILHALPFYACLLRAYSLLSPRLIRSRKLITNDWNSLHIEEYAEKE